MTRNDLLKMHDILLDESGLGQLTRTAQVMLLQHALEQDLLLEQTREAMTNFANAITVSTNAIDDAVEALRIARPPAPEPTPLLLVDISEPAVAGE
jgi:hypothetical protein